MNLYVKKDINNLIIEISNMKENSIDEQLLKLEKITEVINILLDLVSVNPGNIIKTSTWVIDNLNTLSKKRTLLINKLYKNIKSDSKVYQTKAQN